MAFTKKILKLLLFVVMLLYTVYIIKINSVGILSKFSIYSIIWFVAFIIIVHIVKMFRLYLLMLDQGKNNRKFVEAFIDTSLVNIILPFKLGEFYRVYRFGKLTYNFVFGIVSILLDRWIDTIGLLSVITIMNIVFNTTVSKIYIYLSMIIVFVLLLYIIYPSIYKHWNNYFICSKYSNRSLYALSLLDKVNNIYVYIDRIIKGRFIVTYILSIIAWFLEIVAIYGLVMFTNNHITTDNFSNYLDSAFTGNTDVNMSFYILLSASCYFVLALLKLIYLTFKGGDLDEKNTIDL